MTVKIIAGLGMTSVEVARIDNICTSMRYAVVLRETNRADIMSSSGALLEVPGCSMYSGIATSKEAGLDKFYFCIQIRNCVATKSPISIIVPATDQR